MKRNPRLIFGSIVVAGLMATGAGWAQTDSGKAGTGSGTGQTIHPSPKGSEGGSRSERSGESSVPLPKGSPQSGTVDMGKSGGTTGSTGSGSSGMSGSSGTAMSNHGSSNIKEVQQALKDKGYDPGPIDGVMGAKTKEALKSFQSASNLSATGTLNSETAQKLGVQSSSSSAGSSSSMGTGKSGSSSSKGSGSMRSNDTRSSSDTTKGKDTDQPNK
jgi:hypothetical protein